MKELKEKLIEFEEEFYHLKRKIEKYHLIFLLIMLGAPITIILIMNKYSSANLTPAIRILLFSIILIGLFIHFFLRNKFYKKNDGFNKIFKKKINSIKESLSLDNNFKEKIITTASEILQRRGISLTNDRMSDHPFWELLIKNL